MMVAPMTHHDHEAVSSLMELAASRPSTTTTIPTTFTTTPGKTSWNKKKGSRSFTSQRSPQVQTNRWNLNFRLLLQFKDRKGHLRVPLKHIEADQRLGAWVSLKRVHKRKGTLSDDEIRRLDDIGFIWNVYEAKFEIMITALTQYTKREGHCNVPYKHIEQVKDTEAEGGVTKLDLGAWFKNLRGCQRRGILLDRKREEQLENLGFVKQKICKPQEIGADHFDMNFDLLLVFKEREGHVQVPFTHKESGAGNPKDAADLGKWLENQQTLHRHGLLELDRQKWLEVAGVTWGK
jgi:hypothetical protein